MKKSRLLVSLLLAGTVVVAGVAYVAVNTRFGAYVVLDVIGGGEGDAPDHDPATGPLTLTRTLKPFKVITLPTDIEQPSGIQHRGDRVYVATDQAELFVLDGTLGTRSQRVNLIGGPLLFRQGSLEAIELVDGRVLAIGEFGAIGVWEPQEGSWQRVNDIALPAAIADGEYSGITVFGDLWLATSEESPTLVDLKTGEAHALNAAAHLKPGAELTGLQFSGLAQENGLLYILTETHSSILVVDAHDFTVQQVLGITPGPVADLAVRDGLAYVVVDHNYNEPRPPVYVYDVRPEPTEP